MTFAYLAIPYTSKNPDPVENAAERAARMDDFWKACAYLIDRGDHVVSPMTLEPALLVAPDMPYEWPFWKEYSLKMIGISSTLVVLTLDGWDESTGVAGEMKEAWAKGLSVEFLPPSVVEEWLSRKSAEAYVKAHAQSKIDYTLDLHARREEHGDDA